MFTTLTFYGFALMTLAGGLVVVFSKSPVRSVLALIFSFFNAAGLVLIAGAEYLAATFIVVYVGAVVVLFLFIVMTLSTEIQQNAKVFSIVSLPVFTAFALAIVGVVYFLGNNMFGDASQVNSPAMTNTQMIGSELYTKYFIQFQLAGMILLVALIGVIVLSSRQGKQKDVKKQNLWEQITADPKSRVSLVGKKSGEGVII